MPIPKAKMLMSFKTREQDVLKRIRHFDPMDIVNHLLGAKMTRYYANVYGKKKDGTVDLLDLVRAIKIVHN